MDIHATNVYVVVTQLQEEKDGALPPPMKSYYVASSISQVIKELSSDLEDEAVEVQSITSLAPILKVLTFPS